VSTSADEPEQCGQVLDQVLTQATCSLADRLGKRRLLHELFGWVPMSERAWERAEEVQQSLTEAAMHRSAGPVDLLIAATAERERLTLLCDDRGFTAIAQVTGQPVKLVSDV